MIAYKSPGISGGSRVIEDNTDYSPDSGPDQNPGSDTDEVLFDEKSFGPIDHPSFVIHR